MRDSWQLRTGLARFRARVNEDWSRPSDQLLNTPEIRTFASTGLLLGISDAFEAIGVSEALGQVPATDICYPDGGKEHEDESLWLVDTDDLSLRTFLDAAPISEAKWALTSDSPTGQPILVLHEISNEFLILVGPEPFIRGYIGDRTQVLADFDHTLAVYRRTFPDGAQGHLDWVESLNQWVR